jgi:hypothetical protein
MSASAHASPRVSIVHHPPHSSVPVGSAQYQAGSSASAIDSATSPTAMQPSASPTIECSTSHAVSRQVCGSSIVARTRARIPVGPWSA